MFMKSAESLRFLVILEDVLYCNNGVVIAAQCTATFLRSIVLPEFRYSLLGREYAD